MSQTSQDSREVTERRTAKGGGDYVALGRTFSASQTVRFPEAAERGGDSAASARTLNFHTSVPLS